MKKIIIPLIIALPLFSNGQDEKIEKLKNRIDNLEKKVQDNDYNFQAYSWITTGAISTSVIIATVLGGLFSFSIFNRKINKTKRELKNTIDKELDFHGNNLRFMIHTTAVHEINFKRYLNAMGFKLIELEQLLKLPYFNKQNYESKVNQIINNIEKYYSIAIKKEDEFSIKDIKDLIENFKKSYLNNHYLINEQKERLHKVFEGFMQRYYNEIKENNNE